MSTRENALAHVEAAIISLLQRRDVTASICPSEASRVLAAEEGDWRALMPLVIDVAVKLATEGRLRITRGDADLSVDQVEGGPIRLRRGASFEDGDET